MLNSSINIAISEFEIQSRHGVDFWKKKKDWETYKTTYHLSYVLNNKLIQG